MPDVRRQTDDGQKAIRIAHLSFQLRWAKKLNLAIAMNGDPSEWKKELLQYCSSSSAAQPPIEITKKHARRAS
jgi:hypothetical protein